MVRDYSVIDNNDITRLHCSTYVADDWAEFLMECRKRLKNKEYEPNFRVLIDGHEYCKVGELL